MHIASPQIATRLNDNALSFVNGKVELSTEEDEGAEDRLLEDEDGDEAEGESRSRAEEEEVTERKVVRGEKFVCEGEDEGLEMGDATMRAEGTRVLLDGREPEVTEEELAETRIWDDGGAEGQKEPVYAEEVNDDPQDEVDEDVAGESPV